MEKRSKFLLKKNNYLGGFPGRNWPNYCRTVRTAVVVKKAIERTRIPQNMHLRFIRSLLLILRDIF